MITHNQCFLSKLYFTNLFFTWWVVVPVKMYSTGLHAHLAVLLQKRTGN